MVGVIMPRVLGRLAGEHPELQIVSIEETDDDELFARVASGELDCALGELPVDHALVETVELVHDPCVLLVEAGSPLTNLTKTPTLKDIAALRLAIPNWRMRKVLVDRFRVAGLELCQRFRLETHAAVHALVAAGLAAAIMPRLTAEPAPEGTVALPLGSLFPARIIVLYWNRSRIQGPAVARFAKTCQAVGRELNPATVSRGDRSGSGSGHRARAIGHQQP